MLKHVACILLVPKLEVRCSVSAISCSIFWFSLEDFVDMLDCLDHKKFNPYTEKEGLKC